MYFMSLADCSLVLLVFIKTIAATHLFYEVGMLVLLWNYIHRVTTVLGSSVSVFLLSLTSRMDESVSFQFIAANSF